MAYKQQDALLPEKWEIEHILPQKWHANYFTDLSDEEVKEKIEHIGNKAPFEKKLNVVAGNGYFEKKKQQYKHSAINITKKLAETQSSNWKTDDIIERDIRISDELLDLFDSWAEEYSQQKHKDTNTIEDREPSSEDLEKIEEFKNKGWI